MRWDLSDLYAGPADPKLDRDLRAAAAAAGALEASVRGRIASGALSPGDLLEAIVAYEAILEQGDRPEFYASLLFAADTQDEAALKLEQSTREASTALHNQLVFFELELQVAPQAAFDAWVEAPALARYGHWLRSVRRYQPHSLPEAEEKLLAQKSLSGRSHWLQLHEELTGSFRYELEIEGGVRSLTDGEILALLRSPDRDLRRRALETFLEKHRSHGVVLTSIYNAILLDHRLDGDLRRFPTSIAPRHLDNDVDPAAVEAMMDVTGRHAEEIRRYFRLKARLVGLSKLAVSDVYAPIGAVADTFSYEDARDIVIDAYGRFDGRFADLARSFFEKRWIDAELRPGKRHGAFCAAHAPGHHPYVLLSYTGSSRDVSTLAHELGHGIHAILAAGEPRLLHDAPLVLAETASVFGEMLLTERLLGEATRREARVKILCDTLDEIYGTLFRQATLTRFELSAHEARRAGRLGADDLAELWQREQGNLFGDAVELSDIYGWGWSYIPHFLHTPFYCYAYAFGELLVLALFDRYRAEGRAFVDDYRKLLAAGGSEAPARLLARLGFDIARPDFWETGFGVIRRMLDELESAVESG